MTEEPEYENLIYSMIMANKYNYPPAYFEVYSCLVIASKAYENIIDEKTKAIALEYLMTAAELNDISAVLHLAGLYKEGSLVTQDSVKSEYYYQKYDSVKHIKKISVPADSY
jgi:TPR repeat protein